MITLCGSCVLITFGVAAGEVERIQVHFDSIDPIIRVRACIGQGVCNSATLSAISCNINLSAAVQPVRFGAAFQCVTALAALKLVLAIAAPELVIARITGQVVVVSRTLYVFKTLNGIARSIPPGGLTTQRYPDPLVRTGIRHGIAHIRVFTTIQHIRAVAGSDVVIFSIACYRVSSCPAGPDDVLDVFYCCGATAANRDSSFLHVHLNVNVFCNTLKRKGINIAGVVFIPAAHDETIKKSVVGIGVNHVTAVAAVKLIRAVAAAQRVFAATAMQRVITAAAVQHVIAAIVFVSHPVTVQRIAAGAAAQIVSAAAAVQRVIASAAKEPVFAFFAVQLIIITIASGARSRPAVQRVVAGAAPDLVIPGVAGQDIVMP